MTVLSIGEILIPLMGTGNVTHVNLALNMTVINLATMTLTMLMLHKCAKMETTLIILHKIDYICELKSYYTVLLDIICFTLGIGNLKFKCHERPDGILRNLWCCIAQFITSPLPNKVY